MENEIRAFRVTIVFNPWVANGPEEAAKGVLDWIRHVGNTTVVNVHEIGSLKKWRYDEFEEEGERLYEG